MVWIDLSAAGIGNVEYSKGRSGYGDLHVQTINLTGEQGQAMLTAIIATRGTENEIRKLSITLASVEWGPFSWIDLREVGLGFVEYSDALLNLSELGITDQQFPKIIQVVVTTRNTENEIRHLLLSRNVLRSIPCEIRQLTQLETLSLAGNNLRFISPEICQLTRLRTLTVGKNYWIGAIFRFEGRKLRRFLKKKLREFKVESQHELEEHIRIQFIMLFGLRRMAARGVFGAVDATTMLKILQTALPSNYEGYRFTNSEMRKIVTVTMDRLTHKRWYESVIPMTKKFFQVKCE